MFIGSLCAAICGIAMPFAMIIFGNATGDIVDYASEVNSENLTDTKRQELADRFMENMQMFAINMSAVGIACIALSYVANTLFSYTASRQVSKKRIITSFSTHVHG